MKTRALVVSGLLSLALIGCGTQERRDLEYRVHKAESDRDQTQLALDDERAKVVVLRGRLETARREHELTRTELESVQERGQELERINRKLQALLQRRDAVAYESPAVSASPLPTEIDRQLRAFAERHSERVWYDRGRAAVSLANDRLFEPGADEIRSASGALLGELAGIAAQTSAGDYEIIVVGHTDDTPISSPAALAKHPSNWHLSVHRAIAVKNVLVSAGLPEARLGVMGYGAFRPLGDDRARNRRVEVYFARKGEVRPLPPVRPASSQ